MRFFDPLLLPARAPVLPGVFALALCAALAAVLGYSRTPSIASMFQDQDADSESSERAAIAKQTFRDNCLMCHGEELTTSQRLTTKQWAAEVDKMVGWGAPVPPEQKQPLVEYLANHYSERTAPAPVERAALAEASAALRPEPGLLPGSIESRSRGNVLYAANCATCHGADGRGGDLGTNLVGRPVLYQPQEFVRVVRQGVRRMPGFAAALNRAQVAQILDWLREQRYPSPSPSP